MVNVNKSQILSLASSADVYSRGNRYYKEGKILNIKRESAPDGSQIFSAAVEGNFKNYNVHIVFDGTGEIKTMRCNCNAFEIWRGICKHIVAVLLLLSSQNSQLLLKENQSRVSRELNNFFEKQLFAEINSGGGLGLHEEKVHLTPTLYIENDRETKAMLEFTLGMDRQYIIKNLSEFMENLRKGKVYKYGKCLSFRHSPEAFDEFSRQLIELIRWHDELFLQLYKAKMPALNMSIGRLLRIFPQKIDEFFDICENRDIPVSISGSGPTMLTFTTDPIGEKFQLLEEGEVLRLEGPGLKPIYLKSEKYFYIVSGDRLHRTEKILGDTLIHLLKALDESNSSALYFEDSQRRRFITYILPKLRKFDLLEIDQDISAVYDVPEVTKKLYLDAGKGNILCKPLFTYGDAEINPVLNPPGEILDDRPEVLRDIAEEYGILNLLGSMGFVEDKQSAAYTLTNNDDIFNLYLSGLEILKNNCEVFVTDDFKNQFPSGKRKTQIGARLSGNLLSMSLSTDFSLLELLEALDSFNREKKYHRLKNGRFVNLEDENIRAAEEILSNMDLSRKDIRGDEFILPKYRALALDRLADEQPAAEFSPNDQFEDLIKNFKNYKDLEFKVPDQLKDTLRNYQKTGFGWLKMLSRLGFGGILADDMGLGKTIQVITALLSEKEQDGGLLPSLVVTPTSLMYNWEHEIKKFAPDLLVTLITGTQQKRREVLEAAKACDVLITTYDLLKRDLKNYNGIKFKYVVADEAQYIKNPGTQNAKALKSVKGDVKFALTGTPMENSLSELWSIFDFIMPGYLHSHHKFAKHYETPIIKNNDVKRAEELRKQTAPFILRRLKRDVLPELPDKVETTLYAEMTPEQRKIYEANLLMARGELDAVLNEGGLDRNRMAILASITRLRQICCHPALFVENYTGGSGKLELALETIDSAIYSGHRILLFSQFTSMLAILKEHLDRRHLAYFYLDGSTPSVRRAEMTGTFNDGERDIFLISLKAGGTGLNLTGADVVMHFDPWWNPAVMSQATDRAHRIGQENVVQVINLVAKDSIEERIIDLQSRKKDLVESVIVENTNLFQKMSPEELRDLFR